MLSYLGFVRFILRNNRSKKHLLQSIICALLKHWDVAMTSCEQVRSMLQFVFVIIILLIL
jgi:hypothetical protein